MFLSLCWPGRAGLGSAVTARLASSTYARQHAQCTVGSASCMLLPAHHGAGRPVGSGWNRCHSLPRPRGGGGTCHVSASRYEVA